MDVHSLLNVPSVFLVTPCGPLSTMVKHSVLTRWSCRVAMVVDRGWDPEVLLKPVPKSSTTFPYILLWPVDMRTFKF